MTRDEAIKGLKVLRKDFSGYKPNEEMFDMAIQALKQEPSKVGHWIVTGDYLTTAYGSEEYVKCSYCGEDSLEAGNFCPNCGARMESEDKE